MKKHFPTRREFLIVGAAGATALLASDVLADTSAPGIVSIGASGKRVELTLRGQGRLRLLVFPIYADVSRHDGGVVAWEGICQGELKISLDRFAGPIDRLFQRLRLFDPVGKPVGEARFANDLRALPAAPPLLAWPASIKGVTCPVDIPDLAELGVKHTHINLDASGLLRSDERRRDEAFSRVVDGRRVYFNPGAVRAHDRQIRELTDGGINAIGVILNYTRLPGALTHPNTDLRRAPNNMGAFNLTTEEGVLHFRALMEFLSDRYCRGDERFGSVGGWIIGNEIQSTWEWHNMGPATTEQVARQVADELRVAWLSMRNAGAEVPVFASFDHFWVMPLSRDAQRHHAGRAVLDALAAVTTTEGSFPWHVAQHPYPENLFDPRFWNDKTATFACDSPRMTFKNVEILAAYLQRKEMLHDGKPRRLILSEQGFHAGDNPESERLQAAAYALAYYRISQIPAIEAFILHRQVDAREGGLNLGIWTDSRPARRKRAIWNVVKAADSAQWKEAADFALATTGLRDWSEVMPKLGPFPEHGVVKTP